MQKFQTLKLQMQKQVEYMTFKSPSQTKFGGSSIAAVKTVSGV